MNSSLIRVAPAKRINRLSCFIGGLHELAIESLSSLVGWTQRGFCQRPNRMRIPFLLRVLNILLPDSERVAKVFKESRLIDRRGGFSYRLPCRRVAIRNYSPACHY
jgi:hypothetical protein